MFVTRYFKALKPPEELVKGDVLETAVRMSLKHVLYRLSICLMWIIVIYQVEIIHGFLWFMRNGLDNLFLKCLIILLFKYTKQIIFSRRGRQIM